MGIRKNPFVENEYYHLYNRGTNKMQIFNDHWDYLRFQKLLYLSNSKKSPKFSDIETSPGKAWTVEKDDELVEINAYCLMPNHFHILIRSKNEKDVSVFLLKLLTSYSMYFNKKYQRTGALFEGKTKSKHANTDIYLKYLFSYIHLNPVKLINTKWKENKIIDLNKTLSYLQQYQYSSFLDYINNERLENKILNMTSCPEYFKNPKENLNELIEWLQYEN